MKIIITGSTGNVGGAVLARCLEHPKITSVIALTRRPLDIKDPKLNNIIQKDFLKYDNDLLEQLKGAEGCVWALGSPTSGKEVHIDYTMTAVNTFLTSLVPQMEPGKRFRFVYTSGGLVPMLESNYLFWAGAWRHLRAQLDRDIIATETQNPDSWESFVARPWSVVETKEDRSFIFSQIFSTAWILRRELGAAMVDAAVNGGGERIIDNTALRARGQAALKLDE